MLIPKDPPIIDREFMVELKQIIGRCEWPDGCRTRDSLQTCHIRARGMGGGRRKDTEDNLVILCAVHHYKYDNQMGQSPENQGWMKTALGRRTDAENRKIRDYLASRAT